jgi:phosphonate transport system substrate-binding protein
MAPEQVLRSVRAAALGTFLALACAAAAGAQSPSISRPDPDGPGVSIPSDHSSRAEPLPLEAGDPESWADPASRTEEDDPSTGGTEDATADQPAPIRIGVLPRRDAGRTLALLSGLAARLTDTLGRPVEFIPVGSYAAMIDAQVLGRIDGGFYSASAFAQAESLCKCLEPIVTPAAADGTTSFFAIIVAPQAAPYSDVTDLDGAVAATARPDSVGGTRMQVASLIADGIDIDAAFSGFRQTDSPEAAAEAMLTGEADVAFAWSSLSGAAAEGYSRGTLRILAERGSVDPGSLKILWRSAPVAHGPAALASSVPAGDRAAIAAVLIGIREEDPDAYEALEPYYSGGYEASQAEDYRGGSVLAAEGVDAALVGLTREAGERQSDAESPL